MWLNQIDIFFSWPSFDILFENLSDRLFSPLQAEGIAFTIKIQGTCEDGSIPLKFHWPNNTLFAQETSSEFISKSFFLLSIMGLSNVDNWLFEGFRLVLHKKKMALEARDVTQTIWTRDVLHTIWSKGCSAYYFNQGMFRILFEVGDVSHTIWINGCFTNYLKQEMFCILFEAGDVLHTIWSRSCFAYYLNQRIFRTLFEERDVSHTLWSKGCFAYYLNHEIFCIHFEAKNVSHL